MSRRSPSGANLVAAFLLGISLGSIVSAWFLAAANEGASLGAGIELDSVALYALVGVVIAWLRPGHPMGWIFLTISTLWTTGRLAEQYAQFTLVTEPGRLPGGVAAAWYGEWFWIPALFFTFVFSILLFPDGACRHPDGGPSSGSPRSPVAS